MNDKTVLEVVMIFYRSSQSRTEYVFKRSRSSNSRTKGEKDTREKRTTSRLVGEENRPSLYVTKS